MEIRPLRETDSRLEVRRIYEESWKSAYRGIVPQAYLDGIPAGADRWCSRCRASRPRSGGCTPSSPCRRLPSFSGSGKHYTIPALQMQRPHRDFPGFHRLNHRERARQP